MINKKAAVRTPTASSALCANLSWKSMRRHNDGYYCDLYCLSSLFVCCR